MINPLKIATDGYLKRQTKAVLIIAVSGYLNYGTPLPAIANNSGGGNQTEYYKNEGRQQQIIEDEIEILILIEIFMKCQ